MTRRPVLPAAARKGAIRLLSIATLLVRWTVVASFFSPFLLPNPAIVGNRLLALVRCGEFELHV